MSNEKIRHNLQLEKFKPVSKREKLSWEKELLGLYISEHPFSEFQAELEGYILNTTHIKKGMGMGAGNIRIAGVINVIKKIITQKGEIMLFVKIEDTYDSIETIVFPSVYNASKESWVEGNIVIINGVISNKDGEFKVICNEVKALSMEILSDLKSKLKKINFKIQTEAKNLYIFFKRMMNAETIARLNQILSSVSGKNKVYLAVPIDEGRFRKIETNFTANFEDQNLQKELNSLAEVRFVKLM